MDVNLVIKAQHGDEKAMIKLFEYYRPVIHAMRTKYYLRDFDEQDWIQEGLIIFNRCLHEYKVNQQTTLGIFFKRAFENEIVSLVRKNYAYKRKTSENLIFYGEDLFLEGAKEQFERRAYTADPLEQLIVQETLEENETVLTELESRAFYGYFYGDVTTLASQNPIVLRSAYDRCKRKMTRWFVSPDL
ncbi:sigma-70 family RNA polymerase sigma factor [Tetragenococcus osmophilus]|uniref:DNA-directed RNA polymerase sigma factor 30 n=1 Tax=Tetragenococcus osmophilus TaxID=526944 RepID=A0AA38CZL5_9ENTE|nr:helix-turn-helix domain-containing protein [Tetragenococcus osmophilus]AYW47662.1 sigma-70 family RNA polymerase sigma factor [Tetragenococcus osmophilus]GMA53305.1 DNA-directed RNA polymerase sigma factor 30 [Alicyclobacillus contaminans]GMA72732.1 DNA-directed RNA polymerase sigma factor 30 [Tetragenococcus osmophilus]